MWFILYFSIGFVMSIITYVCTKLYDMYEYKYLGHGSHRGEAEYGHFVFSILSIFAWPLFLLAVILFGFYGMLNLLTQKLFSTLETLLKKD